MTKKQKDAPKASAPAPLIPPTAEELRRQHVETVTRDRIKGMHTELGALLGKDLKKADILNAIAACGESVLALALQAKGRLRAASGQTDAFIEAKVADYSSKARKTIKLLEIQPVDVTAFEEVVDAMTPALDSMKRLVKDLDVPGVKVAISPAGGPDGALLDDEGSPTMAAAKNAKEPSLQETFAEMQAGAETNEVHPEASPRPVQTLGMAAQPVIGVQPEPAHALDGLDVDAAHEAFDLLLEKLEEDGVEEGLKRKDWNKAWDKWTDLVNWDADLATIRKGYDLLRFAMEVRKPFSWAVPTEKDLFDHQRKLALAAGE